MGLSSKRGRVRRCGEHEGEKSIPRGPAAPALTGALLCLLPLAPTPFLWFPTRGLARGSVGREQGKEVPFLFLPGVADLDQGEVRIKDR